MSIEGLSIRRIGGSDVELVEPLWNALREHHIAIATSLDSPRSREESWAARRAQYEGWLAESGSFILIAERDDSPVGYAMVRLRSSSPTWSASEHGGEVETLSVLPAMRGQGVGAALIDAAREQLEPLGVGELSLHVLAGNDEAMRFYEREGFSPFATWVRLELPATDTKSDGRKAQSGCTSDSICVVGIDGCRAGWIAVLAYGSLDRPARTSVRLFDDIRQVVRWREAHAPEAIVAVDVPMGLPSVVALRRCDREARELLGARWMCVFEPPDRELFGLDFDQARDVVHRRRAADSNGTFHVLSQQAVQITGKIGEVDRVLCEDPALQRWLVEVHPEVSFRALAGEDLPAKKSKAGKEHRLRLLRIVFGDIDRRLDEASWPRNEVGSDDLLDAYVALWSALRFSRGDGSYIELGAEDRDERGLLMRMVV